MQFRIYDRQTLAYKDGGYVASYTIDDDYIVNNNSTITIVKELNGNVVVGDTVVLIQTSGAYHKGTIINYDNADFTITYKSDKELFNDNILNPYASDYVQNEDLKIAGRFGIEDVALLLGEYFGNANDWARELPLKFITEGDVLTADGEVKMQWNWANASINIVDWLVSLFERYNVSLSWQIDFNIANSITCELDDSGKIVKVNDKVKVINNRNPYYVVTLSAITNSGKIIKDNVANQTITYTEKELPEATVCVIIDKETKEVVMMSAGKNLFNPATVTERKILSYNTAFDYVQEQDSAGTNFSGYIKVDPTKNYKFSYTKHDGFARNILFYDKDKNCLGQASYTPNETDDRQTTTLPFPALPFPVENASKIAYIRINYYYLSYEIQLEQGDTATEYEPFNIPAIYYLVNYAGVDAITLDKTDTHRVFPVKTKYVEFDIEGEDNTEEQTAYENLVPSKFNQAIEIKISSDSKMFDFENAKFGDLYKIINEQGTIDSNYTGRKEESGNKWMTLYFGLGRQNYTDLIQMRLRKAKYQVLYNQAK